MTRIAIDFSGRKPYADLVGRQWDLSTLSAKDRRLVRSVVARANKGTAWPELSSHWRRALIELHRHLSGKELVRLPVYGICQDIASRVGIEQGYFRQRDYRDDLVELIAKRMSLGTNSPRKPGLTRHSSLGCSAREHTSRSRNWRRQQRRSATAWRSFDLRRHGGA